MNKPINTLWILLLAAVFGMAGMIYPNKVQVISTYPEATDMAFSGQLDPIQILFCQIPERDFVQMGQGQAISALSFRIVEKDFSLALKQVHRSETIQLYVTEVFQRVFVVLLGKADRLFPFHGFW